MENNNNDKEKKLNFYIEKYIKSHKEEIIRHVDIIVLYIDSFRKLFNQNISGLNELERVVSVASPIDAVKNRANYLTEYLHDIKNGFYKSANNIIAIKQEFNLVSFNKNIDGQDEEIAECILKTIAGLGDIGKAFGKLFYEIFSMHNDSDENSIGYYDLSDVQDRYLVEGGLIDNDGSVNLAAMTYVKIGE
jgi:hypothetical protein